MAANLLTLPISTHVTEGLAKIYGFKVLRHGTDFTSYFNILARGGKPSKSVTAKDYFHVFKDPGPLSISQRFLARLHVFYKGTFFPQAFCQRHQIRSKAVIIPLVITATVANTLFCPILRFVYKEKEIETVFQNDPDYSSAAYRTDQEVPNHRIGLIGLWHHATFSDAKQVWQTSPIQTITGIAQLTLGLYLTKKGYGFWL